MFISIEEFYKTNIVPEDFDEDFYRKKHPETINFYQPFCIDNSISEKQRLFFHYIQYVKPALDSLNKYYTSENLTTDKKGCHVFSYEQCETNSDIFLRQQKAIESYGSNKHKNITIYNLSNTELSDKNIEHHSIRDVKSIIGCDRDYSFLNDLISFASETISDNDYIIFTNSDCYIEPYFYEFILSSPYDYIEFFRSEIKNDLVVGKNKDGIDGFAIKKSIYLDLKKQSIIPDNLIIGAPYWDAILSNISRKYIKNRHQDLKRLKHIQHTSRWSFDSLDKAGQNNLNILNNLYDNQIIDCRKAEIVSKNIVIKIFDDKTNYDDVKSIVVDERFSNKNLIDFDYNYLFIEKYSVEKKLTDKNIGTTAGTRIHIKESDNTQNDINLIIEANKKQYSVAILDQYEKILPGIIFESNNKQESKLGIVLCFFGSDSIRISAVKRAIKNLSNQTIWDESCVVFVELVPENQESNFNFNNQNNITHIKIIQQEKNLNLFQKESLWNIGADAIKNMVDNYIFIDADTFPQNDYVFAKANKILHYNSNIVFQLGDYVITKDNDIITRIQMLWKYFSTLKSSAQYCFNPCGGFAISKSIFEQIKGFNPYGFLYGGDILFLYEIDASSRRIYDCFLHDLDIFKEAVRSSVLNSNILIKNEDSPLIHVWHGDHSERPYHSWGLKFNSLNFDLHRDITVGENGLLEWKQGHTPKSLLSFFSHRYKIK